MYYLLALYDSSVLYICKCLEKWMPKSMIDGDHDFIPICGIGFCFVYRRHRERDGRFVKLVVTFTASPAMQLFFGSVVKKPPSVAFILIISPGSVAFFQQRALVSFSTGTGKYFSQ